MASYRLDALVRVTGTFKNISGTLTDPTTVTVTVKTPANVKTTYTYDTDEEVVKSSTGVYYMDIDANAVGTWRYRWKGTGALQAAEEREFTVEESDF